jgi:hypothetical protein
VTLDVNAFRTARRERAARLRGRCGSRAA